MLVHLLSRGVWKNLLWETTVSANFTFWRGANSLCSMTHLGGSDPLLWEKKCNNSFLPPHGLTKSVPPLDIQISVEGPHKPTWGNQGLSGKSLSLLKETGRDEMVIPVKIYGQKRTHRSLERNLLGGRGIWTSDPGHTWAYRFRGKRWFWHPFWTQPSQHNNLALKIKVNHVHVT